MKKLINWLCNFLEAFQMARRRVKIWEDTGKIAELYRKEQDARVLAESQRDQYERELRLLQMEPNRAAEQLMQLRVHGMSRNGVIGYGVTAFIPEDVLEKVRGMSNENIATFTAAVADNLVMRAIQGLWYRTPRNNVAAMVFDLKQNLQAVAMVDASGAPRIAARTKEGIKEAPEPRQLECPKPPTPIPFSTGELWT